MINLYIDTSSKDVSIAIIKDNQIISKRFESIPNEHSVYTVSYVDEVLKEANLKPNDIDKIMVVNGPGSFTGIRIGLTIAKVYAYLLNKEIITISSLKALALSTKGEYILSLINAKHNNYYYALYDKDYNEVVKEQFNNKENLLNIIKEYNPILISDEELDIDGNLVNKVSYNYQNIVKYHKSCSSLNPHQVVPNYLKLPQALEDRKWLEKLN